ncbi:hypothetical protein NK987_04015 [Aquiflexum sp. XJ19-10]|nr:hypothetical protein [Aquiflexum gelatinilyticum]
MSAREFDLDLLTNKTLFHKINAQSSLIEELFHDLANEFPQNELLKFHADSKGTKVSKGYNLENLPYQVLDIVRDFDDQTGFNIRVLNWWGNGLFIFIYFGNLTFVKNSRSIKTLLKTFADCNHPSPWAYGQIIGNHGILSSSNIQADSEKKDFYQIFKQIDLDQEFSKSHLMLKREIRFILDNHN